MDSWTVASELGTVEEVVDIEGPTVCFTFLVTNYNGSCFVFSVDVPKVRRHKVRNKPRRKDLKIKVSQINYMYPYEMD